MIQKTDLEMLKSKMEKFALGKNRIKLEQIELDMKQGPLKAGIKLLEEEILTLKQTIGEAAIAEFKITGEKSQLGGVKVQEKKTMSYDPETAFDYAKRTGTCLLLDVKSFEKIAIPLNLDFVKTGTEKKVTLPKEIKLED